MGSNPWVLVLMLGLMENEEKQGGNVILILKSLCACFALVVLL